MASLLRPEHAAGHSFDFKQLHQRRPRGASLVLGPDRLNRVPIERHRLTQPAEGSAGLDEQSPPRNSGNAEADREDAQTAPAPGYLGSAESQTVQLADTQEDVLAIAER